MTKPDLPYVVGYKFSVVEHLPPQPPGSKSFSLTPDEIAKRQNKDALTLS